MNRTRSQLEIAGKQNKIFIKPNNILTFLQKMLQFLQREAMTLAVSYRPLWVMLAGKGIKKLQFRDTVGIGTNTLAKLSKNEYVAMSVIDKICSTYNCRVEDVVEIVHAEE